MRTIAVVNHKGGSGKTTAAVNLAAVLAERGRDVLLIDLDPQCSATRWLGFGPVSESGLSTVLATGSGLGELVVPTREAGLSLVPGDDWLAIAEQRDFNGSAVPQMAVARALKATRLSHELVLIDTPGRLSLLTVAALAGADEALVPVPPSSMELESLSDLDDLLAQVRAVNPRLILTGLARWAVDARTVLARDVQARLEATYASALLPVAVRRTVRAAEAFAHRMPLTRFAPDHLITHDLRRLATVIEQGARDAEHTSRSASGTTGAPLASGLARPRQKRPRGQ